MERGADDEIDYSTEDLKMRAKELTDGRGVDVVYEAASGVTGPSKHSAAISWQGRFLVMGFAAGIPSIPLNLALLKGCQIVAILRGDDGSRSRARRIDR